MCLRDRSRGEADVVAVDCRDEREVVGWSCFIENGELLDQGILRVRIVEQ
jgi:hypothetical protein